MAKQRTVRPGDRWQPVVGGRSARRVVGRTRWRWPRPHLPRLGAAWRRAALAGAVAVLVATGAWWLYHSPLLSVREVAVEGTVTLSPAVVRDIADLEGQSIVRPDFALARERLLALPLVKEVEIGRDWPNGAHVTIVERTPWGLWSASGRGGPQVVIDEEGVVLDLPAAEDAPVIVQKDPAPLPSPGERVDRGAVAVADELLATAERALGRRVLALEFSQASGLTAVLGNGPKKPGLRATFGDAQGYEFKIASLYAVLRQASEEERTLRRVDLRFGDRVAVK